MSSNGPEASEQPWPIDRGMTLGAQVTNSILKMIATGQLVPGQRLVEATIARLLGVGTVPVREALRILAGDGIVEIIPRRGAMLRLMSPREIADTLKGIVGMLMVALEELEYRRIEPILPRLRLLCETAQQRYAAQDGIGALNAMADYQLYLLLESGNRYIINSVQKVHFENYNNQVLRFIELNQLENIIRCHVRITRNIEKRAFDEVRKDFKQNVDAVSDMLIVHPSNYAPTPLFGDTGRARPRRR